MRIHITEEENNSIKKFNANEYMIGVLAKKEDDFFLANDYNIINSRSDGDIIDFYIKPLSPEFKFLEKINKGLKTENLYIGQSTRNENILGIERIYLQADKENRIKETLENKIILFKPLIKTKEDLYNKDEYKIYKNIQIEKILDEYKNDSSFIKVVEIFQKNSEFEHQLCVGKIEINYLLIEKPQIIICGDYLYDFSDAFWEEKNINSNLFELKSKSKIYKKALNHETKFFIKTPNKNLFFIETDIFYSDIFDKGKVELELNLDVIKDIRTKINEEVIQIDSREENKNVERSESVEIRFIENLLNYSLNEGLFYQKKDLINFHICLKTNYLTILAGMSGTGKSKLAKLYSSLLNTSDDQNLLFIPIHPNYTEPSDLLGYYNPTTCLYQSSDTKLVDFLIKASKDQENMYFVIFDEMNLAQIEHWFAPFISIMEEKSERKRILKLYNNNLNCINKFLYEDNLKIGNNIRFIGTINLDETSKDISDRVLDRSNLIKLEKMDFLSCKKIIEAKSDKKNIDSIMINYETYQEWIQSNKTFDIFKKLSLDELELFDELHKKISIFDSQKGVSFRVLEQIGNYLNNIPESVIEGMLIPKDEAIDIQITQRILSKLRGSIEILGELLGEYNSLEEKVENSILFELFENSKFNKISNFEKAKKEILRKARELTVYGYTN